MSGLPRNCPASSPAFCRVRREDALAVHVEGERDVAELGELHRPALHVVVEAPPLVDDEDAGQLARLRPWRRRRRGIPGA